VLNLFVIIAAAILLGGVLFFEKKEDPRGLVPTKTVLSTLFVLAALMQPHPVPRYTHFVITGLVFCLGGDLFLALPQKRMFLLGLVSFLVGHILYIVAFSGVGTLQPWTWAGTSMVLLISGGVYWWLRPHLGSMHAAVLCYIVVITIMMSGACSVLVNGGLNLTARIMIFAGALCFYFSDVFVARDRFLKKEFLNRLMGLPMYYAGQFLLAFSVGLLQYEG
jgi:uncharacterized membrane protein YhhN